MDEATWLACTNPQPMLEFLWERASDRKLRLFACAWCRDHYTRLTPEQRQGVEAGERLADGLASREELAAQAAVVSGAAAQAAFADAARSAAHWSLCDES